MNYPIFNLFLCKQTILFSLHLFKTKIKHNKKIFLEKV